MKLLLLLNDDIHSFKALSLLSPYLKKHQIFILLSGKTRSLKNVSNRLREIREVEAFDVVKFPQKIQEDFNCNFEFIENINSKTSVEKISEFAPQLIISVRFGQILREEIIQIPRFGVVNLHSGILPAYRGVMASFWAVLKGEKEIGTTLHYIEDATIDTGRVIAISRREVDFASSLIENISRLYEAGCLDIIEFLRKVENGKKIELVEQKNLGVSAYYSYPTEKDLEECAKKIKLF